MLTAECSSEMTRIDIPFNERKCFRCGSLNTYIQNGNPAWFNIDGKCYCKKCVCILKYNPKNNAKWGKINNKKWNPKRIQFKEKRVCLEENPRIGFCNICKKNIGDEYINYKGEKKIINKTNMHHVKYHDLNPLKDSLEVCAACHAKITTKKIEIIII
jgi:hypothetical protein